MTSMVLIRRQRAPSCNDIQVDCSYVLCDVSAVACALCLAPKRAAERTPTLLSRVRVSNRFLVLRRSRPSSSTHDQIRHFLLEIPQLCS